jgi:hypothetical protein
MLHTTTILFRLLNGVEESNVIRGISFRLKGINPLGKSK